MRKRLEGLSGKLLFLIYLLVLTACSGGGGGATSGTVTGAAKDITTGLPLAGVDRQ